MRTAAIVVGISLCLVGGCRSAPAGDEAGKPATDAAKAPKAIRDNAAAEVAPLNEARPAGSGRPSACERKPSSAEVFAALVSVNYHAPRPRIDPSERLPVQDIEQALRVLWCDESFGWDARRTYAVARLGEDSPLFETLKLEVQADSITSSAACCATLTDCKLAKADPSFMEGAVWFRLDVPGAYTELAKKLDPQSWSDIQGSWFQRTERQMATECPEDKPEDVDVPPANLGDDWCDVIYERFEYLPDSSVGLKFENSLFFRSELDPVSPKDPSKTLRTYRVEYGVCPGGSHSGRFRGGDTVSDALLRDSGCSSATDFNASDDGSNETSYVSGVKRLHLDASLCGGGTCSVDDARFLDAILRALVVATRISLCDRKGVQPASCVWPVTCDTEEQLNSGPFGCGFAEADDFQCPQ